MKKTQCFAYPKTERYYISRLCFGITRQVNWAWSMITLQASLKAISEIVVFKKPVQGRNYCLLYHDGIFWGQQQWPSQTASTTSGEALDVCFETKTVFLWKVASSLVPIYYLEIRKWNVFKYLFFPAFRKSIEYSTQNSCIFKALLRGA
jgi:hypothetical protein